MFKLNMKKENQVDTIYQPDHIFKIFIHRYEVWGEPTIRVPNPDIWAGTWIQAATPREQFPIQYAQVIVPVPPTDLTRDTTDQILEYARRAQENRQARPNEPGTLTVGAIQRAYNRITGRDND